MKRSNDFTRLSRLAGRLQAALQEEQTRVARELHDDLGQHLTALAIAVAELEQVLLRRQDAAPREIVLVNEMHGIISGSFMSLQRIIAGLGPAALETLGLSAALEQLIDHFAQRYRIEVSKGVGDLSFGRSDSEAIFRIVQEALTNIARHARALRVSITLRRAGRNCILRIEDDGQGATCSDLARGTSLGLIGMRARVERLRGKLSIETAPGQGFHIPVSFPYTHDEIAERTGKGT